MSIISLLFFFVLSLVSAEFNNGYDLYMETKAADANVNLVVGAGWYNYTFTAVGTFANNNYAFTTSERTTLKVTDAFCAGDMFEVYDNGVLIGTTTPVLFDNCVTKTPLPDVAWSSIGWSNFYYFLEAGSHNITIKVVASPFTAGGANIRVDYLFE